MNSPSLPKVLGDIGCLNKYGTHVTANNFTNNNIVFFFCLRFKNSIYIYNNY